MYCVYTKGDELRWTIVGDNSKLPFYLSTFRNRSIITIAGKRWFCKSSMLEEEGDLCRIGDFILFCKDATESDLLSLLSDMLNEGYRYGGCWCGKDRRDPLGGETLLRRLKESLSRSEE